MINFDYTCTVCGKNWITALVAADLSDVHSHNRDSNGHYIYVIHTEATNTMNVVCAVDCYELWNKYGARQLTL